MSPMLSAENLSHSTPDGRLLFENLSLSFGLERVGLIGRNGVGKSTLLKLLLGEIQPQSGMIACRGRIGILRQEVQSDPKTTVADALGVAPALARLTRLEDGRGTAEDAAEADWTLEERLAETLAAVGLGGMELVRSMGTLSGGEATRIALGAVLLDRPDLLVLDEPTNNLDADARAMIVRVLAQWRGGAVVVSHDRAVLRQMDRIAELSSLGAQNYGGNWDVYAEQKTLEREAAERILATAERTLKKAERDAQQARERKQKRDGRGKRSRGTGSQATVLLDMAKERSEQSHGRQSIVNERLRREATEAAAEARRAVEALTPLTVVLPTTGLPPGKPVLRFADVGWSTPDGTAVLAGVSFAMTGPERLAVVGPNGAGKTTLLKLAVGDLEPSAGIVRRFAGNVAMLDQRAAILRSQETILENFRRLNPADDETTCRTVLARFLFRTDAALKPVAALSGGETLRAALACVLGGQAPPQLLVLDEPTNHLDLDSIHAIETALAGYDGALLVVSHDDDFLAAIGIERRIMLGREVSYSGG